MKRRNFAANAILLITVASWGGMYPVAKSVLLVIDSFWLTVIRYGFATLFFVDFFYSMKAQVLLDSRENRFQFGGTAR